MSDAALHDSTLATEFAGLFGKRLAALLKMASDGAVADGFGLCQVACLASECMPEVTLSITPGNELGSYHVKVDIDEDLADLYLVRLAPDLADCLAPYFKGADMELETGGLVLSRTLVLFAQKVSS